jgi:hypothetical protein
MSGRVRHWRRWAARCALGIALPAALSCGRRTAGATDAGGESRVALTNLSGMELDAVYVAPHDARTWQENVLGADEVADGATLAIRFSPRETAARWDLRVEGQDGGGRRYHAEWRNLALRETPRITLRMAGRRSTLVEREPVGP